MSIFEENCTKLIKIVEDLGSKTPSAVLHIIIQISKDAGLQLPSAIVNLKNSVDPSNIVHDITNKIHEGKSLLKRYFNIYFQILYSGFILDEEFQRKTNNETEKLNLNVETDKNIVISDKSPKILPMLESNNETVSDKNNEKSNSPKIQKSRIEKPTITKKKLVKKKLNSLKGVNSENSISNSIGSGNVLQKNNTINNG